MEKIQRFLATSDAQEQQNMLDEFFFDDGIALAMLHLDKTIVLEFLKRLVTMRPQWTPTRCAVQLEALTEKTMAAASSEHYMSAWIYALALLAEVDPGTVQLTDRQVEVAFALAKQVKKNAATAGQEAKPAAAGGHQDAEMKEDEDHDDDDDDGEVAPLDWEPQLEDLPNDLQQVLARHTAGTLTLDARALMEDLPVWANLKAKAETNNHKADASSRYDRTLRSTQQKVLGLQRCYAALHTYVHDEDGKTLGQQFWALLLQLETSLLTARKAASIPGAVPTTEPGLFSKEDLKVVAEGQQINNAGMHGTGVLPRNQVFQSFPPPQRPFPNTLFYHRGNSCLCPTTGKAKSRWKWGKSQTGQKGFKPWKGKSFKGGKAHSGFSKGGYGGRGRSYWPGPSRAPTVGSSKQGQCKRRRTSPGDLVSTETASLPIPPTGRVQPPPRTGCFSPVPGPIPERQAHQAPRECRTSTATSWLGGGSPLPVQKPPSAYRSASPSTQGAQHTHKLPQNGGKTSAGSKVKLTGGNKSQGKKLGKHSFASKVAAQSAVVAEKRFTPGGDSDQGGDHPTVASSTSPVCAGQARLQFGPIPKDFGRLRKKWGSQKSWCRRHPSSPPMVPHFKSGTHRGHKMAVHFRLQGNKSALPGAKIQTGSPPANLPSAQKGRVGSKNRSEGCLFSSPSQRGLKAISETQGGGPGLGVPGRPIWPKCDAPTFSGRSENLRKKVEKGGGPGIYIPGRHLNCRPNRKNFEKAPRFGGAGPVGLRVQNKLKKVHTGTLPGGKSFGLCPKFSRGKSATGSSKNEGNQKRAWKVHHKNRDVQETNIGHPGTNKGKSTCPAFFAGFHRRSGGVFGQKGSRFVGQQTSLQK